MSEITYVESPNGRLYEVVEVPDYPVGDHGPSLCVFDHEAQRIAISDTVPRDEWASLIAGYFGLTSPGGPWSLVPMIGRVK